MNPRRVFKNNLVGNDPVSIPCWVFVISDTIIGVKSPTNRLELPLPKNPCRVNRNLTSLSRVCRELPSPKNSYNVGEYLYVHGYRSWIADRGSSDHSHGNPELSGQPSVRRSYFDASRRIHPIRNRQYDSRECTTSNLSPSIWNHRGGRFHKNTRKERKLEDN